MEGCQVAFGASFKTQIFLAWGCQGTVYCYSNSIRDMTTSLFQNPTLSLRELRIEDHFALVGLFLMYPPHKEDFISKPL